MDMYWRWGRSVTQRFKGVRTRATEWNRTRTSSLAQH